MKHLLWILLAAGCTVEQREYTGPTISIELTSNDFDSVRDTSTRPSFELDSDEAAYTIEIEILTHSGSFETETKSSSSAVASVTTRLTLAGAELPSPAYVREADSLDPSFTSDKPIVIPASARGSVLSVHATGVDGNDLASNVIDFAIELE